MEVDRLRVLYDFAVVLRLVNNFNFLLRFGQLVEELHTALENEKDFLRLVALIVQIIFPVDVHVCEKRQHGPNKFLAFFLEKPDFPHDLSVSVRDHLAPQLLGQLSKKLPLFGLLQV